MNRREALVTMVSGIAVPSSINEIHSDPPPFKLIDKRISGRISIQELQEGECGYITNMCIMLSKLDGIFYFAAGVDHGSMLIWDNSLIFNNHYVWVGRKNKRFYISPSEETITEILKWKDDPKSDGWLKRPAMLAYNLAYPLDNKVYLNEEYGEVFIVPTDWKECAKHKLVERNILWLTSAVAIMNTLRDAHGIDVELCHWDHDNSKLKAALEASPHKEALLKELNIK